MDYKLPILPLKDDPMNNLELLKGVLLSVWRIQME